MMANKELIGGLAGHLTALGDFGEITEDELEPMRTTGLAHDHVRLNGHNLLARVPKQSQMALDAQTNLTYQAACFAPSSCRVATVGGPAHGCADCR